MATRMETNQRPHKRHIGSYELDPAGGPYTSKTLSSGKATRTDNRGYPDTVGVSEWYETTDTP
jgi:hypothetical protein